ncbi:Cyclin F-box domain containing protein, partial [Trichostrongylus colubriformis]
CGFQIASLSASYYQLPANHRLAIVRNQKTEVTADSMEFTNDMTEFPFLELPSEIQLEVLRKLSVPEICACRCVSRQMYTMIENNRMSLARRKVKSVSIAPNWAELVPKRKNIPPSECLNYDEYEFSRLFRASDIDMLHIVNMELSEEFVMSFLRMVTVNHIRISQFNFGICHFCCDPRTFCQLMEAVQLKELCIMSSTEADEEFSARLVGSPTANKMDRLAVGFPSKISDDYLLSSHHSWLAVKDTNVSAAAVRAFILDWIHGRRSFDYMGLSTSCRLEADKILENLEFRQVDEFTVMLRSKLGEKMALSIEENSFVMYNRNAERIMCEIES